MGEGGWVKGDQVEDGIAVGREKWKVEEGAVKNGKRKDESRFNGLRLIIS